MKRCGATTLKGKPCRNGWGCSHHPNNGNNSYIAHQQAVESSRGPIQDSLLGRQLTEKEIATGKKGVAMFRALLNNKNTNNNPCGCNGEGE